MPIVVPKPKDLIGKRYVVVTPGHQSPHTIAFEIIGFGSNVLRIRNVRTHNREELDWSTFRQFLADDRIALIY